MAFWRTAGVPTGEVYPRDDERRFDLGFVAPSPLRFALVLVGASAAIVARSAWDAPDGEWMALGQSTATALAVWGAMRWAARPMRLSAGAGAGLDAIVALKLVGNIAHFYWLYAPTAHLHAAIDLPLIRWPDDDTDMFRIYVGSVHCQQYRETYDLAAAVVDKSGCTFNNVGVPVLYSTLFGAFGACLTVGIPWSAVATGTSGLLVVSIGDLLRFDRADSVFAALVTASLPTYLVTPPLYRDDFIVLLVLLAVYATLDGWLRRSVASWLVVVGAAAAAGTLRVVYPLTPVVTVAALVAFWRKGRDPVRAAARAAAGAALVAGCVAVAWGTASAWADHLVDRASDARRLNLVAHTAAETAFGGGVAGKVVFLLLTPMPWTQEAAPFTALYQPASYAGTVLVWATIAGLVLHWRRCASPGARIVTGVGAALFLAPLFGQALVQAYACIGMPLLVLGAAPALRRRPVDCLLAASLVVAAAHVALFLRGWWGGAPGSLL